MTSDRWEIRQINSGWSIRDATGAERARVANVEAALTHLAMALDGIDRLEGEIKKLREEAERRERQLQIMKVCRSLSPSEIVTTETVSRLHADTLKFLVRFAWEHVGISTGRAAEILGMCLRDCREMMHDEGWEYADEREEGVANG